jgi:hypothetical protein
MAQILVKDAFRDALFGTFFRIGKFWNLEFFLKKDPSGSSLRAEIPEVPYV